MLSLFLHYIKSSLWELNDSYVIYEAFCWINAFDDFIEYSTINNAQAFVKQAELSCFALIMSFQAHQSTSNTL